MYVLDSDTLTLSLQGNSKIARRILSTPSEDLWLPAITVEEHLRGRLATIASLNSARPADRSKMPLAYDLLLDTVRQLQKFQFLPYTTEMEELYQSWPAAVKRLGTRDCRIAATAAIAGFTVVTCNSAHFEPIPGVATEDWNR